MPHIAINTRLLTPHRLEGIGRFQYEVLHRMLPAHPEVDFTLLFDRPFETSLTDLPHVKAVSIPPPSRHPLLWHAWFHLALPIWMKIKQPDVFFSPELYLTLPTGVPQVAVFHDIGYEHFPEFIGGWPVRYLRRWSPRYAKWAEDLITVSEYTRQDIIQQYAVPPEKLHLVYNGCSDRFRPIDQAQRTQTQAQYSQGKPYFYFVGTIQPRKNIETLLRAFDTFKEREESPVQLVIVGRKGWRYGGAMDAFEGMQHKDAVHFTGFVPDEDLNRINAASLGLVYVPHFEGFGIPALEAMYSETAVIAARNSALPEVVGEAAILVDTTDVMGVSDAMRKLWKEPQARQRLIAQGKIQRERFSWDTAAEQVWAILERQLK